MDNRTINEVRKNETKLINEIKVLETEIRKYKEVIDKLSKIIHEIDELRKTTGGYPSNYIDYLLDILKEVE